MARRDKNQPESSDFVEQKNLPEEGQDVISEGQLYKEKNGTQEVIPFFVDRASARVRFAPVGRASEDEMRTSDFLNRFEVTEKSARAEATPEESQEEAEARIKRAETTDQLGRVVDSPKLRKEDERNR